MTTATVPIQITCPEWCEVPAEEHVRDLWNMDGDCIHHMPCAYVTDLVGLNASLEPPLSGDRVELNITTQTSPEGRESAPPIVHLHGGQQLSVSQALALSDALRDLVNLYRSTGGVA